jgi:hypothetical protein
MNSAEIVTHRADDAPTHSHMTRDGKCFREEAGTLQRRAMWRAAARDEQRRGVSLDRPAAVWNAMGWPVSLVSCPAEL